MVNRGLVEELRRQGFGYEAIAERVGVSRQRIHQIVKGYKHYGIHGRLKKYRKCGVCNDCKVTEAEVLHHIDFNNQNDSKENLVGLCRTCHTKRHLVYRKEHPYNGGSPAKTERNESIYEDFKAGMSYIDLVVKYRVSSSRISSIINKAENMEAQGLTINPAGKLSVGTITEEIK